ncbi:MAG: hypothetical protein NT167_31765 [Verrucomicrobia bacterium]|nr:hypothetical protein [Verrucomicrobiota bacterium]
MAEANRCRIAGQTATEAERRLAASITRPPKPATEISVTVAKAYGSTWAPSGRPVSFKSCHRAPVPLTAITFNPDKLKAVAGAIQQPTSWRHWLWERSAKRPETQNALSFLAHLYRGGETVQVFDKMDCAVPAHTVSITHPMDCRVPARIRDGGQHGLGIWYLCNPVDGEWHHNPRANTTSCRSEESLTAFRYAVLESDQAPFDQWLSFIVQLPIRIAAIYTSGSRSIHALIRLDAASKADFDRIIAPLKRPLKVLGADPACLSAVRLTRLPGCSRPEKQGFQKLLYLCPDPPDVRLADLPVIRPRFEALDRWRNICPRWNKRQESYQ